MKSLVRQFGIFFSATVVAGALSILGSTNAMAASPDCGSASTGAVLKYEAYTPNSEAVIQLWYSAASQCAQGRVIGLNAAEIWTDRREPYEGFNGYAQVHAPSQTATTGWFNDRGKQMRACGTAKQGSAIVCTNWY